MTEPLPAEFHRAQRLGSDGNLHVDLAITKPAVGSAVSGESEIAAQEMPLPARPVSSRNRVMIALRHGLLGVRHWRLMLTLWQAPTGSPLAAIMRWRPEIWGMLQAPFISAWWRAEERFDRIIDHCDLVATLGRPFDVLPNEYIDLLDLPELGPDVRIKLDSPRWMLRDGLLVLSLWVGVDRVYSLAFTLSEQQGQRLAYVGGIQGRRSERSLERNRHLTKTAHGMRPPDLLFEIFRLLCREIRVEQIRGVSDDNRHQRSDYFLARSGFADPVRFDYDGFWQERGGVRGANGFFVLPPVARPRHDDEIPPRKRALYRRRREMIDGIQQHLHMALQLPHLLQVQEHEPRWI